MTEIITYECDECGNVMGEADANTEYAIMIKKCGICKKDICEECAPEHAQDETGLEWKIGEPVK